MKRDISQEKLHINRMLQDAERIRIIRMEFLARSVWQVMANPADAKAC